jgi:integrase
VKTVRGVLRPAFQMAVDDDVLYKNPFGFELAGVVVNDSVTREALTRDQMRKFLKFVHDDNVYCKYYEVVYILFHTGMRISEFCGLTIKDIDLGNRIVNIDHQLQRYKKTSGNRGCCKMLSIHHRRPGETKGRKSGGWIYRVPVFG